MFLVRQPCARLRPFVRSLWYYAGRLPHAFERVLPTGDPQLLVNLEGETIGTFAAGSAQRHDVPGAVLSGPSDEATTVDTADQRRIVGVTFEPGGAAAFVRLPLAEARNATVPLEDLWGREGQTLRERLLDAGEPPRVLATLEALLAARCLRLEADALVGRAVALLDGTRRVRDVAAALGLSRGALAARLDVALGLRPKQLARLRRFQRVVADAARTPHPAWAELAARHGYADQPHLVREFRAFSGMTPTAYRPRHATEANHVVWTP